MKYFSEMLNQVFDTAEQCQSAEDKHNEEVKAIKEREETKAKERKIRANEIDELLAKRAELNTQINEKINSFCEDYGSFHTTIKNSKGFDTFWDSLFDPFFRF